MKLQGSITTPGSLALAQVQAQSQQPGVPKAPQPGQASTLVTTTTATTTVAKTTTIARPTPSGFKKDVPVSTIMVCLIYFTYFYIIFNKNTHKQLQVLFCVQLNHPSAIVMQYSEGIGFDSPVEVDVDF